MAKQKKWWAVRNVKNGEIIDVTDSHYDARSCRDDMNFNGDDKPLLKDHEIVKVEVVVKEE